MWSFRVKVGDVEGGEDAGGPLRCRAARMRCVTVVAGVVRRGTMDIGCPVGVW